MSTFARVPYLRGELKRSEIRGSTRYQLTTREMVVQKSQRTYRIALENILGILECSDHEFRTHESTVPTGDGSNGRPYKIVATIIHLVSPAGVIEQTKVSLYTRLSIPFVRQLESLLSSRAG